jgi:hypothetical protein
MSFSLLKSWDDRRSCDRKRCVKGRTWVRRIRWLGDEEYRVKLKLEDGELYREVIAVGGMAQTIWDRFKQGQSIDDSVSILGNVVPKFLKSKKG